MIVGFTGTRKGMNERQREQLLLALQALRTSGSGGRDGYPPLGSNQFHFGGAEGADLEARKAAREQAFDIHWHPTVGVALSDLARDGYASEIEMLNETWHEVFPPLVRNHHIVDAVEFLIAAPASDKEQQRSGTWATIRYARTKGIPVVMLARGEK